MVVQLQCSGQRNSGPVFDLLIFYVGAVRCDEQFFFFQHTRNVDDSSQQRDMQMDIFLPSATSLHPSLQAHSLDLPVTFQALEVRGGG